MVEPPEPEEPAPVAKKGDGWLETVKTIVYALLIALVLAGLRGIGGRWLWVAAWLIAVGTLLFSGSIYAKTFGAPPAIVSVAPYGGVAIMVGWLLFAASAWRRS